MLYVPNACIGCALEFELAHGLAARDGGIVRQDVEAAEPSDHLSDRESPLLRLGYGEAQVVRVFSEFACDRMTFVVMDIAVEDFAPWLSNSRA